MSKKSSTKPLLLLTCKLCHVKQYLQPTDTTTRTNGWLTIPLKSSLDPWGISFSWFNHDWLCSEKCLDKWVMQSPTKRAVLVTSVGQVVPIHISKIEKDIIKTLFFGAQFSISNKSWNGKGGPGGRMDGNLRDKDYETIKKLI